MAKASSTLLKRRLDIAKIVRQNGEVKVDELSDQLKVSLVTIRQDLTYLEQQGYLKRSFGGAIYISPEGLVHNSIPVNLNNTKGNCYIDLVKACLSYINDGDTIFLGHGSLTRKLIPFLHEKKSLRIIMNDIRNALLVNEFSDSEVILMGGLLGEKNVIKSYNEPININHSISHFIIELAAIGEDNELIIENSEQKEIYQQILKKAKNTIGLLLERSLFTDNHSIGKLKNIDVTILSKAAVPEYHHQLLNSNFKQIAINNHSMTYHNLLEK